MLKRKKRIMVTLFTLSFLITQMFMAIPAFASASGTSRISGTDRYKTAVAISQQGWTNADYAVLARGDSFADALCAGPLAAQYKGPILLTSANTLDAGLLAELKRLGVKHLIIIGGIQAVSQNVENALKAAGISDIQRIYGTDRYETSVKIAEKITGNTKAILATGEDYPDALSISVVAAKLNIPILLSEKDHVYASTAKYLSDKSISQTYIVGGTSVLSSSVEKSVPGATRIAGNTRYQTNVAIIKNFESSFNFDQIYIAIGDSPSGNAFADALTGAVLAAKNSAPLALVSQTLSADTSAYIKSKINLTTKVTAFGGSSSVPPSMINQILAYKNDIKVVKKFDKAGIYGLETGSDTINGDVIISAADITLRNTVIKGNLLLSQTIGDGNVTLNGVTVEGKTIVNGGGPNSVVMYNFNGKDVIVEVPDGSSVRLVAEGDTNIGNVSMGSNGKLEESGLTGSGFVTVVIPATAQVTLVGTFAQVDVNASGASITLPNASSIETLNANATCNIGGQGNISTANINVNGVSLDQKPTKIIIADGVTAIIGGQNKSSQDSTSGAAGGGGGGGGGYISPLSHNVTSNAKTFTPLVSGYGAGTQEAALSVTVTASGTNTAVTASLSGADSGDFNLVENISTLTSGQSGTFTVRSKDGLATGTHTATVTITSDEFTTGVSFTVTQVVASATLSHNVVSNAKTFTPLVSGYGVGTQEAALSVTVTASGTNTAVAVSLSGSDSGDFILVESIGTLTSGQSGTFTVRSKDGLATGTHTATVTITSDEFTTGVSFTVTQIVAPPSSLTCDQQGNNVIMTPLSVGYNAISKDTLQVTVTSSGNNANVTAALSGTNSGSFELTENITNLTNGQTGTITVKAKDGLVAGTYIATVTITSDGFPVGTAFSVTQDVVVPSMTIMFYGDGDNDLEQYLMMDIDEMKQGLTGDVNMVALLDRSASYSNNSATLGEDFADTRLYHIVRNGADRIGGGLDLTGITTSSAYEANMGDANTLKSFISYCKNNYPAGKYVLILWNHGGGARSNSSTNDASYKYICIDETSDGDCLFTGEISDVLTSAQSVDVLGFDSCFMGTIEVGYQFRPGNGGFQAQTMIASAPKEWAYGWQYDAILSRLSSSAARFGIVSQETDLTMGVSGTNELYYNPGTMTNAEFGGIVIEEQRDSTVSDPAQSLACYDLSKAGDVKTALDNMVTSSLIGNMPVIENIRDNYAMCYLTDIAEIIPFPYLDLYDLIEQISKAGIGGPNAFDLLNKIDNYVLYSFAGSNYMGGLYYDMSVDNFKDGKNGVSIFFPLGGLMLDVNTTPADPADDVPVWAYEWWYNSIYTEAWWPPTGLERHLYGNLKWCADGAVPTNHAATNWFEMLDMWYDIQDGTGGYNGYDI